MSDPKDRKPSGPTPPPADDSKRSGRAGVDERGNSVWEWQLETGVYSRDISTQKLKKLDLGDLSIAETAEPSASDRTRSEGQVEGQTETARRRLQSLRQRRRREGRRQSVRQRTQHCAKHAAVVTRCTAGAQADGPEAAGRVDGDQEAAGAGKEGRRRGVDLTSARVRYVTGRDVLPDPFGERIFIRRDRCLLVALVEAAIVDPSTWSPLDPGRRSCRRTGFRPQQSARPALPRAPRTHS